MSISTSSLFSSFAALSILATLSIGASGCAVEVSHDDAVVEGTTDGAAEELSAKTEAYVVLRHDNRKCMSPMCGGYWIREVNIKSTKETYVSALDLSLAGLSEFDAPKVLDAPAEELLLKGKLGPIEKAHGTRPWMVTAAWRGMPGVTAAAGDLFYDAKDRDPAIQCITAPCNNALANKVGKKTTTAFTTLAVDQASLPLVDQAWLARQVLTRDAIVAAHFRDGQKFPGGFEKVLDASQVFLKIPPQMVPCPRFAQMRCPEGQLNVFNRSADRCTIPAGCATPGMCAQYMPTCADGYSLVSWTAPPFACPAYACDPTFFME